MFKVHVELAKRREKYVSKERVRKRVTDNAEGGEQKGAEMKEHSLIPVVWRALVVPRIDRGRSDVRGPAWACGRLSRGG